MYNRSTNHLSKCKQITLVVLIDWYRGKGKNYILDKYSPGIMICPNLIKDILLGRETISAVTT